MPPVVAVYLTSSARCTVVMERLLQMTWKRLMLPGFALLAVTLWLPTASAIGQVQEDKPVASLSQEEKQATPPARLEGLWPSPKIMELMLVRWADRLSLQYELDEAQRSKVRGAVKQRWGKFLSDHRAAIQPVVNELIEMRLETQPPTKERVQAWAEQAAPVFEKLREQLEQSTAEFREVLTPTQRTKFDADASMFDLGVRLAEQKLSQWRKGEYKEDEFWRPPSLGGRKRRAGTGDRAVGSGPREATAEGKRSVAEKQPAETDQIAIELAAWREYVEAFIQVYGLDEGQRTAVLSILSELTERATAHRDRRRQEIAELENRVATFTGAEDELVELKKQLTELYGPIDEIAKELKGRIEQIPTAKQRAAAREKEE